MDPRSPAHEHRKLADSLREMTGFISTRTRACPSDELFAAWFDGALQAPVRADIERHVTDCRYCLFRAGMLGRLAEPRQEVRLPAQSLAAAKQRPFANRRGPRGRSTPWAAAAAVVLAIVVTISLQAPDQPTSSPKVPVSEIGERSLRSLAQPRAVVPRLISPVDGSTVTADELVVQWSAIPDSRHYDVYLLSEAGELLEQQRVDGTSWQADLAGVLVPGQLYFVRVDADMGPAGVRRSSHVHFTIEAVR